MYIGKTQSGFEFEIAEATLNNMELVDAIAEAEDNPLALSRVVQLLLGKDGKKKLYDHLRTEEGNVPVDAVSEEITSIMEACGEAGKN